MSIPSNYTVSKRADKEIDGILEHSYKNFGLNQALKYKTELDECFQLLADNPNLGRKCDEVRAGYQRHEHARHIIFYRKRKNDILIVRLIDNRRDIKQHL